MFIQARQLAEYRLTNESVLRDAALITSVADNARRQGREDPVFVNDLIDRRVREALDVVQSKETGPAPAHLGRRFFAWILDGLIVFIVASVATLTAGVEPSDPEYGWVILASFLGYRLLTPFIWRGTPAKRLLGLIVASGDGGLASAGQLLGRELTFLFLALIPVVNLINALVVLFASNHRGWHDHAANTIVVRKRSRGGNP